MKPKVILKIIMDFLMTVLMLVLMGYHLWGDQWHEWLGVGLCVLFIIHQALNWGWYKNLFRGKYTIWRTLQAGVNMFLLLAVAGLMYSGIVLSNHIFAVQQGKGELFFARQLHMLCSYWGFTLIGIHLGLHWTMLLGIAEKHIGVGIPGKRRPLLFGAIGFMTAVYGISVMDIRNFTEYLFLQTEFTFLDFSESKLQFCVDYLSVIGLYVFFVHYGLKILRKVE